MKVTVLIPSWNSATYIARALDSILATGYGELEILVMDNESADETHAIVSTYQGSHVRCVIQKDGGMYEALNRGIELAQGDVICWLGADDQMGENAIQKVVPIFDDAAVQWVAGEGTFLFEGAASSFTKPHHLGPTVTYRILARGNVLMSSSIFFRKSYFKEVGGFDERFKLASDYDLWLRFANRSDPVVIREPLCIFSYNGNNASSKSKVAMYRETLEILRGLRPKGIFFEKHFNILRMRAYIAYNKAKSFKKALS
jgi:glycosyltransferase involved in cell wall biosynthesis